MMATTTMITKTIISKRNKIASIIIIAILDKSIITILQLHHHAEVTVSDATMEIGQVITIKEAKQKTGKDIHTTIMLINDPDLHRRLCPLALVPLHLLPVANHPKMTQANTLV
mmetsp:Transcript_20426/g.27959  ORF Transcript_20426/g.27959 Transcript_20426/m.27959 type:complete len:113 (+) Transcript_20426:483-821(+)